MKQISKCENGSGWSNIGQLCLVIFPWLFFLAQEYCYPPILRQLIAPSTKVPLFLSMAPFYVLLILGVLIAWKQHFPVWSYPLIGTIFFFGYREVFQFVIQYSSRIMQDNPEVVINSFRLIVVPLSFAFLLAMITRKDWLLACFVAYPYTTIIQAWYTFDKAQTPFHVILVSFVLFTGFAYLFFTLPSSISKFGSLFAGTLAIGVGFYLYQWNILIGGGISFILVSVRLLLIITFPLIIHKIPLYHKLFMTKRYRESF